jgi:hypothetical protein
MTAPVNPRQQPTQVMLALEGLAAEAEVGEVGTLAGLTPAVLAKARLLFSY